MTHPPAEIGMPLADVDTPALVIDLDAFERNLRAMAENVAAAGVRLRPHAKTHKCAVIARRQMALGAVGVCCAQHIRDFAERGRAIESAASLAGATVELLAGEGIECETVAGAGTGTWQFEAASGVYNELQAGSYIRSPGTHQEEIRRHGAPATHRVRGGRSRGPRRLRRHHAHSRNRLDQQLEHVPWHDARTFSSSWPISSHRRYSRSTVTPRCALRISTASPRKASCSRTPTALEWYHDMSRVTDAGPHRRSVNVAYDDEVEFEAVRWLHEHADSADGRPFALTVSFISPHRNPHLLGLPADA